MFELQIGAKNVKSDLTPGVYVGFKESGTGKTYLHYLLEAASEITAVYTVTYQTIDNFKQQVINEIKRQQYDFIFLDRYDLYVDQDINDCLKAVSKTTPVLVDLKNLNKLKGIKIKFAEINLTEKGLELYDKSYI